MSDNLVEVRDLKMYFPVTAGLLIPRKVDEVRAVDGVSFDIRRGETFGLVGESGSGKTTLGLCLLQLYKATEGHIIFDRKDLRRLKGRELRDVRRHMQAIFQDPYGSLNPRMNAADIISEPLKIHHVMPASKYGERVNELLSVVGLEPDAATRYPHEFSAGQRQRIGIARALAVGPEFVVCDEPVSALDVCVQAQILNLLVDLQSTFNLTYLFIAHDLAVVGYMSNRIAVMYHGRFMELGLRDQVFENPLHPYTRLLLSAVPIPDRAVEKQRKRLAIADESAAALEQTLPGCSFRPRCTESTDACRDAPPAMEEKEPGHWVACWKS